MSDKDIDTGLSQITKDNIGETVNGRIVVAAKQIYGSNGFVIFLCKDGISVKGNFDTDIITDAEYEVSGKITTYKGSLQIDASSIKALESSNSETAYIASFLADNIKGIGESLSLKIAGEYGKGSLDALLERPEEVAKKIPGLSFSRACDISLQIEGDTDRLKLFYELRLLGLSKAQSEAAYEMFGSEAVVTVRTDPYLLIRCSGIGFDTCERLAASFGSDRADPLRFEGAVEYVLTQEHISTGNTRFDPVMIKEKTLRLLGSSNGLPEDNEIIGPVYEKAVRDAVKNKRIVVYRFRDGKCEGCEPDDEGALIAHKRYFAAEASIKKEISGFLEAGKVLPDRKEADSRIKKIAEETGLELSDRQLDAIYLCLYSPIAIVTGGPGTGKTTITKILAEHLKREKISYCFCAPTGRAAKRLSEASGVKASTIHRLLEIKRGPDEGEDVFVGKNSSDPIDARVVIVDESSMVDTLLFDLLLKAIKPDSSLILIGDPDQLPSVGPGNVLSDLISCGAIPKVKLEYVFRQSDESSIASNAVRILRGEELIGNDTDFRIIREDTDEEALKKVKELALNEKGEDTVILSPTKQNILGTVSLNGELQALMKEKDADHIRAGKDLTLHPGDRVMQVRNNYSIEYYDPNNMETQTGVFNGEIGQVIKGDFLLGTCSILFDDGKTVIYDKKMLEDIDLSYAMTVHKSQGCEFDNVIIALGRMNYKLFSSKLLYTAVTRGKKNVSIVYSGNSLERMIKSRGDDERETSLKDLLSILENRYGKWGS